MAENERASSFLAKKAKIEAAKALRGEDVRSFPGKDEEQVVESDKTSPNRPVFINNDVTDEKGTTSINISQECMNELNFICKKMKVNKAIIIDQLIS